jgi:hypothetical protein
LIFNGKEPVAAIAAQSVTVSVARLRRKSAKNTPLDGLEEKLLVCGNLLSWGMHGICFAPNVDHTPIWPAVAEAIYRLRRVDKLFGDTAFVMVKDIPDAYATSATALSRFSYRELETEPNMVLEISPKWKSYDDYLASLTSKYRKQSKQIEKEVEAAGCTVTEIKSDEIARDAEQLHALYLQTHKNARLRLVTLPATFLPTLAREMGDDMRFTVLKRGETLLGFVTTVKDGETAGGYYTGFDRAARHGRVRRALRVADRDHGQRRALQVEPAAVAAHERVLRRREQHREERRAGDSLLRQHEPAVLE